MKLDDLILKIGREVASTSSLDIIEEAEEIIHPITLEPYMPFKRDFKHFKINELFYILCSMEQGKTIEEIAEFVMRCPSLLKHYIFFSIPIEHSSKLVCVKLKNIMSVESPIKTLYDTFELGFFINEEEMLKDYYQRVYRFSKEIIMIR